MSSKNTGGRPSIPVNPLTAERLKRMRMRTVIDGHRETQDDAAKVIGYKKATYARYEKGERGIADEDLKRLAEHWNVPVEYLSGQTDCATHEAYQAEQWAIEAAALSEIQIEEEKQIEQYKSFFSICGFRYTKLSGAAYDFNPESTKPHSITDTTTGITATLDDSELQALIDRLRSTIQLECFIKSKQA